MELAEKFGDAFAQPVQLTWQATGNETDMAAACRVFEADVRADLLSIGQKAPRQEGIVEGIDDQGGDGNLGQPGFGRTTLPIVVSPLETM